MSLSNRPFIGSWVLNRSLVRHTPDAIVMINGYTEFGVCTTCNKQLDVSKYITQISCDATTDPIATANLTLSVPRHEADSFSFDGNYILQTNLEVIILMRGYFPMRNFGGEGQDPSDEEGFDANNVPMYPYYQVFRGVTTNVTHDYNGGFYTATLSCANLLHFWQNLKLSVNGSVFGQRPLQSMVEPHLIGHKFTGANPYSIIYTLVKVGFGAAFGADFNFSQSTNIRAKDDDGRESLYAHAAQWWEKRWTENSGNLRMYGINGTIFNAFQQAYLGRWFDTREQGAKSAFHATAKQLYAAKTGGKDLDPKRSTNLLKKARELAYDPLSTAAAVYDQSGGGKKFATEDVLRMQAFTLDIGKISSINLFETEYMSKMEIVEAVKTVTGYEFYQDVDGDLVFKPPMYNMDTRDDPVYRIEDRDLISISETETEPEATMMKGTGSHFSNVQGHGMDGWLGVGGVFIDYRLVAKYGYKEETFESNYLSSRQALFISAMNRLDLANAGVKSASITIPLRPELRPGYPIYVEHLDCFYYVKSMSHSFQFGGQCTTSIQGIAKRAKFLPPMEMSGGDGNFPSIDQVRLDAPDEFPSRPLYGYPHRLAGEDEGAGPPRIYGFPNVVLAMDPDKINLDTVDLDRGILTAEGYLQIALASGFLERGTTPNTFILRSSGGEEGQKEVGLEEIQREWVDAAEAASQGVLQAEPNTTLGKIIQAIEQRQGSVDTPDAQGLVNYLSLQTSLKSMFAPGTTVAGKYRYFSCSHPDERHQAPGNMLVDQEAGELSTTTPGKPDEGYTGKMMVITDAGDGKGITTEVRDVVRGIKIASLSQKEPAVQQFKAPTEIVSTADVRFVTFGPQVTRKKFRVSVVDNGLSKGANFALNIGENQGAFASLLESRVDPTASKSITERFETEYDRLLLFARIFARSLGVFDKNLVKARHDKAKDVSTALDKYTRFPDGSAANPISELSNSYQKKSDAEGVGAIAGYLSKALGAFVKQTIASAQKLKGFSTDYTTFMEFRATFIKNYTDGAVNVPDASPGKRFFFSDSFVETNDWTPIFPVSDARGYEVFGNLPYGRGVTIAKYAEIVQSTMTGNETDSGPEAAESSQTLVGSMGSNASSIQAIEKFFVAYLLVEAGLIEGSPLEALNDVDRAAFLASQNNPDASLEDIVQVLTHRETSQNAKIRNAPVTSFFRGQAIFGDTAAVNLANLDVDGDICICKGVEASYLLQGFSEEFVELFDDPVEGYEQQRSFNTTEGWKAARDAMAGRVPDTRITNLAAQFTAQGDLARTYGNTGLNTARDIERAGEATQAAAVDVTTGIKQNFEGG